MSRVFRLNREDVRIYLETDDHQLYYFDENSVPLGNGAMGTVYLGHHYETGDCVAVKRVKSEFSNIPSIRERAKQEAYFQFSHPNIVEMLGYCEVLPDKGSIFIISKYIPGDAIDHFIVKNYDFFKGKNWYKNICELCLPVFDALDYIHFKGIVHADVKPSNIMVEAGKNVRLIDLGIAQVHMVEGTSGITGMMGTPRYAAPEQFQSSKNLDKRADIYELGVTIYELLAKKNPFEGSSLEDIKKKHSLIVLPKIPGVPYPVLDVLRKATAPNRNRRYDNVLEFKKALMDSLNKGNPSIWWIPFIVSILLVFLLLILLFIFVV